MKPRLLWCLHGSGCYDHRRESDSRTARSNSLGRDQNFHPMGERAAAEVLSTYREGFQTETSVREVRAKVAELPANSKDNAGRRAWPDDRGRMRPARG